MDTSWRHQFLLAMPALTGSYFGHTITYLCDHGDDGAMGLIINRPVEDVVRGDLFEQLGIDGVHHRDRPVVEGGPVQRDRGFVLHSSDLVPEGSLQIADDVVLSTSREILELISRGRGPERFLVCVGYAGWSEGQLEAEMAENSWLSCPADADVIFDVPFGQRVDRAAASLGIDFALISGAPGHA